MSKKNKKPQIKPFSPKQQQHYERVARLQYGSDTVNESIKRWNSYSKEQQDAIFAEAGEVYTDLTTALESGKAPHSAEVQAILERWHENIRHFYEPTLEILRGLGEGYRTDPAFMAFFEKFHIELPEYLGEAITQYVDALEYAEIERMLAEDDLKAQTTRLSQYKSLS